MLIKVYTDIGEQKPVELIAKIINTVRKNHTIKYLSPTGNFNDIGKEIYNYENVTYEIDDGSITQYFETDDEEIVGFKKDDYGFTKISDEDDESEYEQSSSESESEDTSLDTEYEDDEEDFTEEA